MSKYKYAVCGVASAVRVLKVWEMPKVGVTTPILNLDCLDQPYFGGPGFNVFYGLLKLGVTSLPVLTYSDKSFEEEFSRLKQEHGEFETAFVNGPPDDISTRVIMIQDSTRDHITMATRYGDQTPVPLRIPQKFDEIPFGDCEFVIMTVPRPENMRQLFEAVKRSGKPMAMCMRYDPNTFTHNLLWQMLIYSKIVFANAGEAKYIAEEYGLSSAEEFMLRGNTDTFIVTQGKHGCTIYVKEDGHIRQEQIGVTCAPKGNVDAVGAGDGFISGYMYGYAMGKPAGVCAQYGSTVSSFVIEEDGSTTNLPTVEQMMERNKTREDDA